MLRIFDPSTALQSLLKRIPPDDFPRMYTGRPNV